MSSWLTSWAAAFRIARREALRNKTRNILIIAMLMLPVFAVTALETVWNSIGDLSTQERLTRTVGSADAWITRDDTQAMRQNASVPVFSELANWAQDAANGDYVGTQPTNAQLSDSSGIRAVLPNATVLPETTAWGVLMHGPAGSTTPEYTKVDLTKPELSGAFDLLSGRVPRTASELDLTPRAIKELGARIGGTITLPASASRSGKPATFTVVGEMYQPSATNVNEVFALPSAADSSHQQQAGWFVLNPGGVSWSQVQTMNKSGYVVTSRDVVLDPPPASQVPYSGYSVPSTIQPYAMYRGQINSAGVAILGIGVGVALLEVVLLAGPAFAVSARRREREYAIIGATGADAGHLRRIVLADGLLFGAIAGLLGAGLGFGVGTAVLPWFGHFGTLPGHVHVDVLHVVGVTVLAMILGLCSAWMPARSVAKRDILGALSGRRVAPTRRVRAGRLATGLVLIGAGACGVFLDQRLSPTSGAMYVVAGIAAMEIGGMLCTPAVINGMAKLGRILPLGPRLALRDSARHPGRTAPAVAAMFATVAGAVAVGGWLDSSLALSRDNYLPALMSTQVGVPNVSSQKQASQIVSKLDSVLPITGSMVVQEINAFSTTATDQWQFSAVSTAYSTGCKAGTVTRPGTLSASTEIDACGFELYGTEMALNPIGGPAVLKGLTGIDDANADAVLDEGGAVVFSPGLVRNGKVTFVLQRAFTDKAKPGSVTETTTYFTAPAVYENPQGIPNPGTVVSPALAQKMGVATEGTLSLVMDLRSHITAAQQTTAGQVLNDLKNHSGLVVEDGYVGQLGAANLAVLAVALLLAIASAAIATALALADGRADHETLTAVGGSPWTRRWLAGSTALVITGLGIVIGVPIGLMICEGLVRVSNLGQIQLGSGDLKVFIVPWLNLGFLVIVLPVLTALGAIALARSKTPRIRRIEF